MQVRTVEGTVHQIADQNLTLILHHETADQNRAQILHHKTADLNDAPKHDLPHDLDKRLDLEGENHARGLHQDLERLRRIPKTRKVKDDRRHVVTAVILK